MSLNETSLLSQKNILAATLVHFHLVICTIIIRVGMTQTNLLDAMRCVNNLGATLAEFVNAGAGPGHLAVMSPIFRHICAR
jgi:hypothetical protein